MSTEENYKEVDGKTWQFTVFNKSIAAGTSFYAAIEVKSRPVYLKQRIAITNSLEFYIALYEGTNFSGGTATDAIRNKNRIVGDTPGPQASVLVDVLPSPIPIPESDAISVLGINATWSQVVQTVTQEVPAAGWMLKPNTDYVIEFNNGDQQERVLTYIADAEEITAYQKWNEQ